MKARALVAVDAAGSAGPADGETVLGAVTAGGAAGAVTAAGATATAAAAGFGLGELTGVGAGADGGGVLDADEADEAAAAELVPEPAVVVGAVGPLVLVVVGAGWVAGADWERGTEAVPPVEVVGAPPVVAALDGAVLPEEEPLVVVGAAVIVDVDADPLETGAVVLEGAVAEVDPEPPEPDVVPPVAVGLQEPTAWPAHGPLVQVIGTTKVLPVLDEVVDVAAAAGWAARARYAAAARAPGTRNGSRRDAQEDLRAGCRSKAVASKAVASKAVASDMGPFRGMTGPRVRAGGRAAGDDGNLSQVAPNKQALPERLRKPATLHGPQMSSRG